MGLRTRFITMHCMRNARQNHASPPVAYADSKWHMDTEIWYMWEAHTANVNNETGPNGSDLGSAIIAQRYSYLNYGAPSGAICKPTLVYCYSYEFAALNYRIFARAKSSGAPASLSSLSQPDPSAQAQTRFCARAGGLA